MDALISSTAKFLDHLEDVINTASSEFEFAGTIADAQVAGSRLTTKSQSDIFEGMAPELALTVAKQIGRRIALARYVGNPIEQITPWHDLAYLFSHVIVPDRDEARRRSSKIAERVSRNLLELKDTERAAIAAMTSALSLTELSHPSREDLLTAYERLSESYGWRKKGTPDSAYHNFNLSLARRRLVEIGEFEPSETNFTRIIKGFDRANQLFEKYKVDIDLAQYHENILETLKSWLHEKVSEIEARYVNEIPVRDVEALGSTLVRSFQALRSNPASFGYQETPNWVPSEETVLTKAVQSIPRFEERLEDAELYFGKHRKAYRLSTKLYELRLVLTPIRGTPEIPYASLESLWQSKDYENYLHNALVALGFSDHEQEGMDKYAEVLRKVYLSLKNLRRTWPTERLHHLLELYPEKLRFSACELAAFGYWQEAFRLLEETRGLRSSGTAAKAVSEAESGVQGKSDYLWMHLTHSPRGTYLICNLGQDYFGTNFTYLNGAILAEYFAGLHPVGLIHPLARKERALRAQAIDTLSKLLSPIADWLLDQAVETVVIHSGGFYQTFPIWSLGELPNAISEHEIRVFQVPSQTLAMNQTRTKPDTLTRFAIQDASHVAGSVSLEESAREVDWLSASTPASWSVSKETATPSNIMQAVSTAAFLHFSGHSLAGIKPTESFLNTHGGPLTVESILEGKSSAQLVFLSSCESGLPQNYSMQDEVLSIQSAFWYIGVRYALGTYWSVTDRAAGLFSHYFYESLFWAAAAERHDLEDAIYVSWVNAMTRLRASNPAKQIDWAGFGLFGMPYRS